MQIVKIDDSFKVIFEFWKFKVIVKLERFEKLKMMRFLNQNPSRIQQTSKKMAEKDFFCVRVTMESGLFTCALIRLGCATCQK